MDKDIHTVDKFERHERMSALPIWIAAAVWIVCAIFAPMYMWYHYIAIAALSAVAFAVSAKLCPKVVTYTERKINTGSSDADAIIAEIGRVTAALELSKDPATNEIDARIDSITEALAKISAELYRAPEKSAKLRKFQSYYLPTIAKLAEKYVHLSKSGTAAEAGAAEIGEAFGTVAGAMQRQLDAIMSDDILDISTDIDVLETMVSGDGLDK